MLLLSTAVVQQQRRLSVLRWGISDFHLLAQFDRGIL
jgi:hypothetical protein